jgi:hypothetical protein
MFGSDNQQIVGNTRHGDSRKIERFGIDDPVGGYHKELSESGGIYVAEGELGLSVVETVAGIVVVVGEDVLREGWDSAKDPEEEQR